MIHFGFYGRPKLMVCSWIMIAFLFLFVEGTVSTEFSSFDPEESTLAFVNLTYLDLESGRLHTEKAEIGKFGIGRVDAASGLVVHVRNLNNNVEGSVFNNGCEYPFENKLPNTTWIALIKRGGCHFQTKILHAQRSNASAVVVYNDEDNSLKRMNYQVPNMTAIFITLEKGLEIASLVDNGTQVMMYITVGSYPSRPNINRTSVLFVSISFIVLMIISLAWLVFYYVQRFRYIHAKDQLARRLCSAARKALAKIPVKNIKEVGGDYECCAVCIEPYKPSDVVRMLPCKHIFHKSCVDPWLLEHRTCPMCKMDILKFYGLVYSGSQESVLQIDVEDAAVSSSGDHDSDEYPPSLQLVTPQESPTIQHSRTPISECVETYTIPNISPLSCYEEKSSPAGSDYVSLSGSRGSVESSPPPGTSNLEE